MNERLAVGDTVESKHNNDRGRVLEVYGPMVRVSWRFNENWVLYTDLRKIWEN